jgi:ankyrin repeat protein
VGRTLSPYTLQVNIEEKGGSGKDQNGDTALHFAASIGDVAVTEQLIAARCNVNVPDWHGNSPLHSAAVLGYVAVTKELIVARCNVDLQDIDGLTPLHDAAIGALALSIHNKQINKQVASSTSDPRLSLPSSKAKLAWLSLRQQPYVLILT